ncbi:hypothetical protein [Chryseobacterium populi]|uniref:PsbP C-terminal domain-containing protein n=1 Tax=Chryseobacterium populi TaxID=1144316 RepID=J2T846_9FLAO|nr:hypothetical protein [Chryseobacterium populi]EJL74252.1 hypothetical protein PMI13_00985 [Chryseobacterium populi]
MKNICTFILFLLLFQNYSAQSSDSDFYSKDFKWTIKIPEGFEKVNNEEWAKMQGKGEDALEKTSGQKVINQAKIIFVVKSSNFNYLEANYQPFDPSVDGNYEETNKAVNDVLYQTFKDNMPGSKIDTVSTKEKINNLLFYKYVTKITMPNNMVMELQMYSRLFDKKEFTINIMFMDPKKGEEMINAWKASKFN